MFFQYTLFNLFLMNEQNSSRHLVHGFHLIKYALSFYATQVIWRRMRDLPAPALMFLIQIKYPHSQLGSWALNVKFSVETRGGFWILESGSLSYFPLLWWLFSLMLQTFFVSHWCRWEGTCGMETVRRIDAVTYYRRPSCETHLNRSSAVGRFWKNARSQYFKN
jgi:hypothetical protein